MDKKSWGWQRRLEGVLYVVLTLLSLVILLVLPRFYRIFALPPLENPYLFFLLAMAALVPRRLRKGRGQTRSGTVTAAVFISCGYLLAVTLLLALHFPPYDDRAALAWAEPGEQSALTLLDNRACHRLLEERAAPLGKAEEQAILGKKYFMYEHYCFLFRDGTEQRVILLNAYTGACQVLWRGGA